MACLRLGRPPSVPATPPVAWSACLGGRAHRSFGVFVTLSRFRLIGSTTSLPIFSFAGGGVRTTSSTNLTWPAAVVSGQSGEKLGDLAFQVRTTEDRAVVSGQSGEKLGDLASLPGFRSVPLKIVRQILVKQYVNIWELLPETRQLEAEGSCCHSKHPRRSLVTDISL